MRLHQKLFYFGGDVQEFEIYPIGDVHLGARACDERAFKKTIKEIAEKPNAIALLMGDQMDAITRTDPRFDSAGLADWIPTHRVSEIANVQLEYTIEAYRPIKDKIIGALEGNHEEKLTKHYGVNIHRMFCNALGIEDLSYSCGLWLQFQRKIGDQKGTHRSLQIYAHHGHGGGRKDGAIVNRLHDLMALFEARVYLMGHTHRCGWAFTKPRLAMNMHKGVLYETSQTMHFGSTGSYLKTWDLSHSGYAETAGFPPVAIGGISFSYHPEHDVIREHTVEQASSRS